MELIVRIGARRRCCEMLLDSFMNGFIYKLYQIKWRRFGRKIHAAHRVIDLLIILLLAWQTFQLKADLGELPLGAELIAADTQYLSGIGQAQRPRLIAQSGLGNTGDLQRDVRADGHHALTDRIHHPEHLPGQTPATVCPVADEGRFKLDQRRFDLLVAARAEGIHDP